MPPATAAALEAICRHFGVDALYAFGSRARALRAWALMGEPLDASHPTDADLAALPAPGRHWNAGERVDLTLALEDLLGVPRVDLVVLVEATPFLALEAIKGELLYRADAVREAEFELYVLRRAGDLAGYERERRERLLAGSES
jgi:hypothetical protein